MDPVMFSVYMELNGDKRWLLMNGYCVRKFAECCLKPADGRKMSYIKLVGHFYRWCEEMKILGRMSVTPSVLWKEICRQIEVGQLPYEVVQNESGKRFLSRCAYRDPRAIFSPILKQSGGRKL